MIGAFAGSFDPPTVGHEDTIRRAAAVFEEVIVLVASNSLKHNLLEPERRVELLKAICADLKNVRVELCPGLTVESAKAAGANVLIRSMRNPSDYEGKRPTPGPTQNWIQEWTPSFCLAIRRIR
ncbi:adenylyltransferase/cytidyltransferase family protein [Allobaculum sp. Allo2]|uniref:adenylyltransferase/cytidyltransferase family protein n=1 Tax=Allobaculum sp. Allo2 TaxID=2853432 RepID=UPI001F61BA73|nr:adenylyltransferase/cytidyltransferase family protein [Allobaculum sp. Allo2]UNT93260.1 adenylyltransferase/cytidyltransferase family protein [Allobaculum sp. Allo2]